QELDLDTPWISYRLASALRQAGRPDAGLTAYQRHLQRHPENPASQYAYALLLESVDRWDQARAALRTIPRAQWDADMAALDQRLLDHTYIAQAQALYDAGQVGPALAALRAAPQSTAIQLQI